MKLLLVIAALLLLAFHSVLCGSKCSETAYGKYDVSKSKEFTREEEIPFPRWNIPFNRRRAEEKRFKGTEECPQLYQRYSTDHTFCKETTCDIITEGITEKDKNIILNIHNTFRSKLASGQEERYRKMPSAANMMEMEWDDDLARVAQHHASLCDFHHDGNDQRAVENFDVGQNLAESYSQEKNWNIAQIWYKEELCFFFPEYINPFQYQKPFGHFSQVTWAKTWKIGCGFTAYRENGNTKSLYTCNYGPAGNDKRGNLYIEGAPCSKCPENTKCSKQYPGLCKSVTKNGPQLPRPSSDEYILFCDFSHKDPKECSDVKVEGSRSFSTGHIYSGNYKTVVLNGGESISIDLGKAKNKGGFCPFLYSRFGPNNAKDNERSVVEFLFTSPEISPMLPSKRTRSSPTFSVVGTHMRYDGELQTIVTIRAEEDAAPQYFDIKYWGIRKGKCDTKF